MSISGIAAAARVQPSAQQISSSSAQHRHGGHHSSISDVGAQGSSVASAGSPSGKTASKINISV
jgi:hypothetical protein